ncbi:MAG: hypothetical protein WAO20_02125 [Acidobacteriota bacterium]
MSRPSRNPSEGAFHSSSLRQPSRERARNQVLLLVALALGAGTLLTAACSTGGADQIGAFDRAVTFPSSQDKAELRIPLSELGADFPRDWSGYEALVLEVRASSPQRMQLKIFTADTSGAEGPRYSRVIFQPYPDVWIRAALPVALLAEPPKTGHDMASVGNRSRIGYYLGLWGPFVPLKSVDAIVFEMEHPVGDPTLEVRSVRLAKESPGDAVLDGLPLVDEFGQYVHQDWPGKATAQDQLEGDWKQEEESLKQEGFGYCRYGGYAQTQARATGFFRVEQIEGRWWFVDPDGHLFLSVGSDVIRPEMATPVDGRLNLFSVLPPDDLLPQRGSQRRPGASFLTWNLERRFGGQWMEGWLDLTIRRMGAWGLNTVGNWSSTELWESKRVPYAIPLSSWETEVSYLGLPDVYSDEFLKAADERARAQCEGRRDDPWLLGYFLANEPPFPQKELQTVDLILAGPDTATRRELESWLASGDTPERRKEFIGQAFDRYIQVTSAAVRKYDPNHLNLGMRGGGRPTDAEIAAARAFDVYSVNIYNYEVSAERVQQIASLTGKPILIGEFHFGTPARGLAASLVQVKDQKERGVAYRFYVEGAFATPEMIGTHWFQWADQPCTGRFDGENYNIGLVDVTDRPYSDLIEALRTTHARLYGVHSGQELPFDTRPAVN